MGKNKNESKIVYTKQDLKELFLSGVILIILFSVLEFIMSITASGGVNLKNLKPILIRFPFRAIMAMSLLLFFRSITIFFKKD